MIQTLPLVLFIVMAELAIGSYFVLFVLDWRSEVKRSFLVLYAVLYLLFTGLTYLFQQNFATQPIFDSFGILDQAWTGWQSLPLLLFFLLQIPYTLFLFMDKKAGVEGDGKKQSQAEEGEKQEQPDNKAAGPSLVRILRLASGGLAVLSGAATLLVMGMIFRPLAPFNLGGAFTVAGFFAAALAIGGVMTAMWLGHWYLVTPALTERPLLFSTTLVLAGLLAEIVFSLAMGPIIGHAAQPLNVHASAASSIISSATPTAVIHGATPTPGVKPVGAPTVAPFGLDVIFWLRILVGFVLPITLGALSWKLVRDRSFQSATGMLYLIVVCTLAGEIMARGLFLAHL